MRSLHALVAGLVVTAGGALEAPAACANGIIVDSVEGRGAAPARGSTPVVLTGHKVSAVLHDRVADVTVEQTFHNRSTSVLEGVYLFPLPEGAVVHQFAMSMGGRMVEGAVIPAAESRRVYEGIVRRRADPGLLEYAGRGLYRASVFPIEPAADVRVRLTFQEVLSEDAGTLAFRCQLATDRLNGEPVETVDVDVRVESDADLKAVYCPSHRVTLAREGERKARVTWNRKSATQDRDFLLYVGRSPEAVGFSLASSGSASEDGTFLAVLAPRVTVTESERVPKDVIFVLDTSGSMEGRKLVEAKRAVSMGIEILRPLDRFNVITFATAVRAWRDDLVPAAPDARRDARAWLDQRVASGGTDIDGALSRALATQSGGRLLMVVFVTDGRPTVGEGDPDAIVLHATQANASNARVFTFGVGSDLNVSLLDRVAEGTGGVREYVTGGEDLELATARLYGKIDDPVLADVKVDLGADVYDVYPRRIPDLFAGGQIVLFGRYRKAGARKVTLSGTVAGRPISFAFEGTLASDAGPDVLPRLWAQRKIAYLLDEIRLHGENGELVREVERLGTRFAILTPYTSGLVVDDAEFEGTAVDPRPLPRRASSTGQSSGAGRFGGPSSPPRPPSAGSRPTGGTREPPDPTSPPHEDPSAPIFPPTTPTTPMDPSTPPPPSAPSDPSTPMPPAPPSHGKRSKPARAPKAPPPTGIDRSKDLKEKKDADAVEDADADVATGTVRRAAGHTFVADASGRFVDTLWDGKAATTKVVAFSEAYFALLTTSDDIAKFFAVGRRLIFVQERKAYEVVPAATPPPK